MNIENDILIVDEEISNLRLLTELLEKEGYQIRRAAKAQTAIDSALAKPPGLILLDVRMPDMDGFEACRRLKRDKRTRDVPVIFISALQGTEAMVEGFDAGGVDFISKPFQEKEVLIRVKTHLQLHNIQQNLEQLVEERTAEVAKSESLFRNLMEQSPMDIVILTPEGQITEVNTAWMRNWDVQADTKDKVLSAYNMRTDSQLEDLGLAPLVEKAFAGESVVLPPIHYIPSRTFGLEDIEASPRSIQLHLYAIKDMNGSVESVVCIYMDITELKQAEIQLRTAFEEIAKLKDQLQAESEYLQQEIKLEHNFKNIIGQSEALKYVLHRVEQVAPVDSPVLIMGETGTGKELIARALHELSPRGKRALVKVNCAALPRELIESELFGREKGAYTGATTTQVGRFELAKGSTLFLDEIGELPLEIQAKLLRVLESGEFERLGSSRTLHSDARIIAVTNRLLEEEVRKGRFREDLWYRLKVFPITVPPLCQRPEDIPLLVKCFIDQLARKTGKRVTKVPERTMKMLQSYPWPGNVRELKHAVESALIAAQGDKLNFDLPPIQDTALSNFVSFEEMERDYILSVLKAKNWIIKGREGASTILGLPPSTLRHRIKKLGLKKP